MRPPVEPANPEGRLDFLRDRARRSTEEVVRYIDSRRARWGVEPICKVLQFAPATYYAARTRPPSERSVRDEELKVDAEPPIVSVRSIEHRRGVRVTVRSDASGVDARATQISFGDGHETKGRASVSHVYARAGVYTIVAHVRDRVGNHAIARLRVRAL